MAWKSKNLDKFATDDSSSVESSSSGDQLLGLSQSELVGLLGSEDFVAADGWVDGIAFSAGGASGIWTALVEYVWEAVDIAKDLAYTIVAIVKGELADIMDQVKEAVANISFEEITDAVKYWIDEKWGDFSSRWNAESAWDKWFFRGNVIMYTVAATLIGTVVGIFTGGGAALMKFRKIIKVLGLDKIMENVRKVAKRKKNDRDGKGSRDRDNGSTRRRPNMTITVTRETVGEINDITAGRTPMAHAYWSKSDISWTEFKYGQTSIHFDEGQLKGIADHVASKKSFYKQKRADGYEVSNIILETTERRTSAPNLRGSPDNVTPQITSMKIEWTHTGS